MLISTQLLPLSVLLAYVIAHVCSGGLLLATSHLTCQMILSWPASTYFCSTLLNIIVLEEVNDINELYIDTQAIFFIFGVFLFSLYSADVNILGILGSYFFQVDQLVKK